MAEDWRTKAKKQGFDVGPMTLVTELPDGSRIEVTDPEIVPMSDAFAHRQLTYTRDGSTGQPALRIVFEVRDGVPVCVDFHLSSGSEGQIRAKDLNAVNLDGLRDDVYGAAGVFVANPDGGYVRRVGLTSFRRDRNHVRRVTRRRTVTPEILRQVADVHDSTPHGSRIEAIRDEFSVSERTALRYIAQAKQEGLING
jgi:hypothetical protein